MTLALIAAVALAFGATVASAAFGWRWGKDTRFIVIAILAAALFLQGLALTAAYLAGSA